MLQENFKVLEKREAKFKLYKQEYDEYISASKKEKNVVQEYQGRELLELIQNAEDESFDRKGIIKIKLSNNILTIQNSGKPFSYEGILSLMTANFSVKDSTKYIGNKGLGFRAVLGWSNKVSIFSRNLSVSFSREDAKKLQDRLEAEVMDNEIYQFDKYLIPIFSAPNVEIDYIEPDDGMDTLIRLECKDEALNRENGILSQLHSINGKELLFLKNTGVMEIQIGEEYHKKFEIIDDSFNKIDSHDIYFKKSIIANNDSKSSYVYKIYQKIGEIDFVNIEGETESKQYLISIAIPVGDAPIEKKLYSFFRTNIDSPFNFILNATLELNQSRNDIIPSVQSNDFNAQVVKLIPDFIIESIKNHLETDNNISYELIKLLVNLDKKFLSTSGYDFYNSYISKMKSSKIFPTVNNEYISHLDQPVLYNNQFFSKHLIGEEFKNLLQWTDDLEIYDFYASLGRYIYAQDSLVDKINKTAKNFSINDRIELIISFVDEFRNSKNNTGNYPFLLLDSSGKEILSKEIKVFNKPSDSEISKIPVFLSEQLRFLSFDIFKGLEKYITFKTINKIRETIDLYLQYFGVSEYSFKALESSINSTRNQDLTRTQSIELLGWIYILFKKQKNEDLSGVKIRVNIPCTDKKDHASDLIYFNESYDNRFYAGLLRKASSSVKFLDKKEKMNLGSESNENLINFFKWLGVNRRPKIIEKRLDSNNIKELKSYISNCLSFYAKNEILKDSRIYNDIAIVFSYDYLEDILKNVDFDIILKWLLDEYKELNTPLSSKKELPGSRMTVTWPYNSDRNLSYDTMDSYVRWKLMSLKWIAVKNNDELQSVVNCMLEDINIIPFMYQPNINYASIKKYNDEYSQLVVDQFLSDLRIIARVKDLSYNQYYRLLQLLPEIDNDLKITRKIYDILMDKTTDDNNNYEQFINSDEYKKFKADGKVLTRIGKNLEFYSASESYYSDKKDLCNGILEKKHILDIARKSGQDKVSKVFGVQLFKNTKVEILEITPSPLDKDFKIKVENIKPYIYVYRNDKLSEIKNIKICLGNNIAIRYSLNDQENEKYDLKDYESIYSRDKGEAYISIPMTTSEAKTLYSKYEFYESFAELITVILDVARDKEIYKNLIRDTIEISKRSLLDTFGNKGQELLDNARRKLGFTVTHEELFWSIIAKITNQKTEKIKEGFPTFNYANVNAEENIPLIKSMFDYLKIDIKDFNDNSNGNPVIDITESEIKSIRNRFSEIKYSYTLYLYNLIRKDDTKLRCEKFEESLKNYDFIYQQLNNEELNSINNDLDFIISKLLKISEISELTNLQSFSIRDIRQHNISTYSLNNAEKYKVLEKNYTGDKIELYATFDELEELYNNIQKKSSQNPEKSSQQPEKTGLTIEQMKSKIAVDVEPKDILITANKTEHSGKNSNGKGKVVKVNPQTQLDNGCIAEYFVYSKLIEKYGKVKWISGNAQKVLNLTDVDDSKGFDMIYIDEDNNERFVEVKSSQDKSVKIKITKNEVETGLENSNKYDIHFVNLNENQEPVKYYRIKNFFEFQKDEDFFNNSKFHVETDNYDIRAKISDMDD